MSDQLNVLASLISDGIADVNRIYKETGKPYPALDDPNAPPHISGNTQLQAATNIVLAAAAQLIDSLRKPSDVIMDTVYSMHTTFALRTAVECGVAEMLREAGPEGLSSFEIGQKAGVEHQKLGRVLRFLAARHIFKEVRPDVFANNRNSAALDTGKPFESIKSRPLDKYENAKPNMAAFVSHASSEPFSHGALLLDQYLLDPESSFSDDPAVTPFSRAQGHPIPWFEFIEKPENERLLRNNSAAMSASASLFPNDLFVSAFDWASLKAGSKVVDVGGGVGSCTLPLCKAFPHLRYVVQDRAAVVPQAHGYWNHHYPEAIKTGLVDIQANDFFGPQPTTDASIFMMRFVLHDWPDVPARKIMSQLRAAARPDTKMILLEFVVPYTCNTESQFAHIPGAENDPAPWPLLPSLGPATSHVYFVDMRMMNSCNAPERTLGAWIALAEGTGWELEAVKRGPLCALVYKAI
ncbi:hypothetical protein VKT23_013328 [Stygiomarasmius scandens]